MDDIYSIHHDRRSGQILILNLNLRHLSKRTQRRHLRPRNRKTPSAAAAVRHAAAPLRQRPESPVAEHARFARIGAHETLAVCPLVQPIGVRETQMPSSFSSLSLLRFLGGYMCFWEPGRVEDELSRIGRMVVSLCSHVRVARLAATRRDW